MKNINTFPLKNESEESYIIKFLSDTPELLNYMYLNMTVSLCATKLTLRANSEQSEAVIWVYNVCSGTLSKYSIITV